MLTFAMASQPAVVEETDTWLVVDKPAGWHTVPGQQDRGRTLCDWVFERYPECATVLGSRPAEGGLLHRLDQATSGLVLFARDQPTFDRLKAAAAAGTFVKEYTALCAPGSVQGLEGSRPFLCVPAGTAAAPWQQLLRAWPASAERIAALLRQTSLSSLFRPFGPGSARVACAGDPATADRRWETRKYETSLGQVMPGGIVAGAGHAASQAAAVGAGSGFAWIPESALAQADAPRLLACQVLLSSGYRHQIRAHFAWLGLPLFGDSLYGEADRNDGTRLALKASGLRFPGPGGAPLSVRPEAAWN